MRLALVTDAWPPQVNGVVRTLQRTKAELESLGHEINVISPDQFNFDEAVTVITNDRVSFMGKVERSVPTLLKWAARDDDRTMLFGAELHVIVN